MLKLLRAATLNHRGHRLERAILGLRQSAQVSARHRDVVPRAGAEEMAMAVEEHLERLGDFSTNDPVSHHPSIRLPDEPQASIRPPSHESIVRQGNQHGRSASRAKRVSSQRTGQSAILAQVQEM